MRSYSLMMIALLASSVSQAQMYHYTVNVINQSSNADIVVSNAQSKPAIPATKINYGNNEQTFEINDNGKSLQIWAGNVRLCYLDMDSDSTNQLDFEFWLKQGNPVTEFAVTIMGGYVPGGYQFNCLPHPKF